MVLSFDLDFDGLGLFGFRQGYGEHAVFAGRINFGLVNIGGQTQLSPEAAIGAFHMVAAFFFFLFEQRKNLGVALKKSLIFQNRLDIYSILLEMRLSGAAEQVYMGNPRLNNYGFWHYNCRGVLRNCIFDSLFRKGLLWTLYGNECL